MGKYLAAFQIKETKEWRYVASPEWDLQNNPDIDASIDCGTNEELFLAIASLRNDTDKNQWFTDGDKWILCPEIKFSTYWTYNDVYINTDTVHKATVNELIEHFKTKKK